MSSRRITCSCIAASNTAWRPLPSALARYMATSASRMTSSGLESAVASAMPIDAPTNSSRPSSSNGACRLCWTRSAIIVAAEAGDRVVRAQGGLQPARDRLQQLVAAGVAERVVDHLEAVDVEEEHG